MGIAALVVEAGEEVEDDEPDLLVEDVPLGVVAVVVGIEDDVVPAGVVPAALVVEAAAGAEPEPGVVVFKQAVETPAWTVNGADCAVVPVLSRIVRSRLVPEGKASAAKVNEVEFCCPRSNSAAVLGLLPSWTVRK